MLQQRRRTPEQRLVVVRFQVTFALLGDKCPGERCYKGTYVTHRGCLRGRVMGQETVHGNSRKEKIAVSVFGGY